MAQDKIIAVDHSREEGTLQVLDHANLLHRCRADWNGVYLEYHYSAPHETPEHYPTQHVIAIQTEGVVQTERRLDGQVRKENIVPGDICVVPAYTRHWIRSQNEQGLILLSFDPTYVARVARETIEIARLEILPHFAQADPLIYHIGLALKASTQNNSTNNQLYVESLGVALGAHLIQHYSVGKHPIPTYTPSQTSIQQAIAYINDRLIENLSLEAIATAIGMSQYHFSRMFKQAIGLTPWQYVMQQRIELAKRLLARPQVTIAEVSHQLGFSNQAQFTNFFRKHTGVTPTQYRQGR
jgi:AraC family transcriptional regulator